MLFSGLDACCAQCSCVKLVVQWPRCLLAVHRVWRVLLREEPILQMESSTCQIHSDPDGLSLWLDIKQAHIRHGGAHPTLNSEPVARQPFAQHKLCKAFHVTSLSHQACLYLLYWQPLIVPKLAPHTWQQQTTIREEQYCLKQA